MKGYNSSFFTDRLISQCLKADKQEWVRTVDGFWDAKPELFSILDSHNSCF